MSKGRNVNITLLGDTGEGLNSPPPPEIEGGTDFMALFILIAAGLTLYWGWPASLWLLMSLTFTTMVYTRLPVEPQTSSDKVNLKSALHANFMQNLFNAALGVSIGLLVVCLIQIGVNTADNGNSKEFFFQLHLSLSELNQVIGEGLGWQSFLIITALLLIITLYYHKVGPLNSYLNLRDWVGRVSLVLFTVSSFTFFTHLQTQRTDGQWINELSWDFHSEQFQIHRDFQEREAYRWLADQFANLEQDDREYFQALFSEANQRNDSKRIIRAIAYEFSHSLRQGRTSKPPVSETRQPAARPEYFTDLHQQTQRHAQIKAELVQTRSVAIEAFSMAVESLLPQELRSLGRVFVSTISSSVVKTAVEALFPTTPAEIAELRIAAKLSFTHPEAEELKRRFIVGLRGGSASAVSTVNNSVAERVNAIDARLKSADAAEAKEKAEKLARQEQEARKRAEEARQEQEAYRKKHGLLSRKQFDQLKEEYRQNPENRAQLLKKYGIRNLYEERRIKLPSEYRSVGQAAEPLVIPKDGYWIENAKPSEELRVITEIFAEDLRAQNGRAAFELYDLENFRSANAAGQPVEINLNRFLSARNPLDYETYESYLGRKEKTWRDYTGNNIRRKPSYKPPTRFRR